MSLKRECPKCHLPEQWVDMPCGYCGSIVPAEAKHVAPDGTARVEEVIGWRAWSLERMYVGGVRTVWLESPIFTGFIWYPGGDDDGPGDGWMIARCASLPGTHSHRQADPALWPPVKTCGGGGHGCGFYAGRTREHLIGLGYGRHRPGEDLPNVIGSVQMQGKIIPASNGWRAQMCRPRKLFVPDTAWRMAKELEKVYGPYGVEVEVGATMLRPKAATAEWCPKCTARMNRSTTCPLCGFTIQ